MSRQFWEARLRQFGHTGWNDPLIYAFDQHLRLAAVKHLMNSHVDRYDQAIDFGCGIGDFSKVLAQQFRSVMASDISPDILRAARGRLPDNVALVMADDLWARIQPGSIDLILSITVLMVIVQDAELQETLRRFRESLRQEGALIVLESFGAPASQGYMRSWTEEAMLALFEEAGLGVVERHFFAHPVTSPAPGFVSYQNSLITRALGRLGSSPGILRLLGWYAARWVKLAEAFAPSPTGTSLFVFKKA